jgi:hypothetical protein
VHAYASADVTWIIPDRDTFGRQRVHTDSATNSLGYRQGLISVTWGREILVPNGCQTIKDLTGVITNQAPDLALFAIPWWR